MPIQATMNFCLMDKVEKEYSYKEWIDYAADCGFCTMEISIRRLPEDDLGRAEVIQYAKQKGFELSLHAPYGSTNITDTNIENRALSIERIKDSIDLAAKHGLRVVTFHPGRCSSEDEDKKAKWKELLQIVSELATYAKEKKVRVGLENMERRKYELVYIIEDLNRFAHIAENNPYFGVTLDFAHFSSHSITNPDLRELKLPIYNVHLSQGYEGKMHFPLTIPNGMVDVEAVCRRLKEVDYDGFVVFEMLYDQMESKAILEKTL